jgi:hypothetical protein
MPRSSKVPLSFADLPQQRIYEVVTLPPRPTDLVITIAWEFPPHVGPKQGVPRNPTFLIQTEWAQTRDHSGVNEFHLHARRHWWLLWTRWLDDVDFPWRWYWAPVAYCPRKGVSQAQAATYLLVEYFRHEGIPPGDAAEWINEEGFLSVADLNAIKREARAVDPLRTDPCVR